MKYSFRILQKKILILVIIGAILIGYFLFRFLKEPELTDFPYDFKPHTYTMILLSRLSQRKCTMLEFSAAWEICKCLGILSKESTEVIFEEKMFELTNRLSPENFDNFKDKYNIIIIGTLENDGLIKKVHEAVGVVGEVKDSDERYGLLEIFRNPSNPLRKILIITGSDEIGVKIACDALISGKELRGNRMVIKPEEKTISGKIYLDRSLQIFNWVIDFNEEPPLKIWRGVLKGEELIDKAKELINQGKEARATVKGYLTTICWTPYFHVGKFLLICQKAILVTDYNFIED